MSRALAIGIGCVLALALRSSAQTLPAAASRATESLTPAWMLAWSPLAAIAEHPRALPRAPQLPHLLLAPAPRVGLLWTIGNPAALPSGVEARWNALELRGSGDRGDYRRPMDPEDVDAIAFAGLGWETLGRSGALAGRVVVDQEVLGRVPFTDFLEPHASSSLILADSSLPEMRRVRAQLEGAFGWRFGDVAVGVAGGLEVRDHRTQDAPFPRIARLSAQGVAAGVVWRLPVGGLDLGAHARWTPGTETVSLFPEPATGTAFLFHGYAEPTRAVVAGPGAFFRRAERDAYLWSLAAGGESAGFTWALGWTSTDRREDHFTEQSADPDEDRWDANGWVLSGAAQRALIGDRLLVTAEAWYSTLDGDAFRSDLQGSVFRATEEVWAVTGDVRYLPSVSPWAAAFRFALQHERRARRDFVALVRSEVESWSPGFAMELSRSVGTSTRVSIAYGVSFYSSTAVLPNPDLMGSGYVLLLAPELSLYAVESRPWTVALGLRQRLSPGSSLLLRGSTERASPREPPAGLPFPPSGDRTLWSVSLTLVLTE